MILLLKRCQKPKEYTIARMAPLDLDTLVKVVTKLRFHKSQAFVFLADFEDNLLFFHDVGQIIISFAFMM
jgi:hypothetical protein